MPFFKGKEDMGVEASLKLLDLAPNATIGDANHAYTNLHQMIDRFYQEAGETDRGSREEDMDLLTCAYEKTIAHLSDHGLPSAPAGDDPARPSVPTDAGTRDVHFTINFPTADERTSQRQTEIRLPEPDNSTVEDAISITERRLLQAETDLPEAQAAVHTAASAAKSAGQRHIQAKQSRINATVAAKSAKSRALLLEIEAKRTMDEAIAIAERARDRVAAARDAARQARQAAEAARQEAARIRQSEDTAAAEVVCAEDRLASKKAQLQTLTHTVLQARHQMRMFQAIQGGQIDPAEANRESDYDHHPGSRDAERQQMLADLLAMEASLQSGTQRPAADGRGSAPTTQRTPPEGDQRQHPRVVYPPGSCPALAIGGHTVSVLDLSSAGMRLQANDIPAGLRIVRGTLAFGGEPSVEVAGKVVRQDDHGVGVRLVTRIGRRILDRERQRLSA